MVPGMIGLGPRTRGRAGDRSRRWTLVLHGPPGFARLHCLSNGTSEGAERPQPRRFSTTTAAGTSGRDGTEGTSCEQSGSTTAARPTTSRQVPRRHPADDRAAPAGHGSGGQQAGGAGHEGGARRARRGRAEIGPAAGGPAGLLQYLVVHAARPARPRQPPG